MKTNTQPTLLTSPNRKFHRMKQYFSLKRVWLLSIFAAAAGFGIAAVHPPRTVPINGTFGTTFKFIPTATPGVFDDPIEGVGNVPTLGFCTIVVEQTVDFRIDPPTLDPSNWVLTFAGGDQLNVSFHGIGEPDQTDPAFAKLSGTGTITGGTGRFENATGELRARSCPCGHSPRRFPG